MKIENIPNIPPGNPFLHDLYHMGTDIGKNCVVMYSKYSHEEQPYIIIINPTTGERIRIIFNDDAKKAIGLANLMNTTLAEKELP